MTRKTHPEAVHRTDPPPEGADVLLAVADKAVLWWTMKRPLQWSVAQHVANPTINCPTDGEKELARAVAGWCELQQTARV